MAPPLHERFIQECERREMTPSDFIRRLVDAALEQIDTPRERDPVIVVTEERMKRLFRYPPKYPSVRGFAIGGGEITAEDQQASRQANIQKKRK
jgi:hypothetical protein